MYCKLKVCSGRFLLVLLFWFLFEQKMKTFLCGLFFMAGRFSVVVRSAQHVKGLELKFWRFEI